MSSSDRSRICLSGKPFRTLEKFPFVHTMAFLDLMGICRTTITRVLEEITQRFISGRVSETRNEWSHGQKQLSTSSLDNLREAVEYTREAVLAIEEYGFSRQQYRRISDVIDGDNRRTSVLASPSGRRIIVTSGLLHLPGSDFLRLR